MPVKDPENYKQRGIRMENKMWEELGRLSAANGRSASKEAVAAIHQHLKRARQRGKV